jgi:AICAR transformylase/IMP cyclohydrolase PurH
MAKTPLSNFIIIGTDGKVAIGTNKGQVSVVSAARLSGDLAKLIKKRQEVGKKLTEALAKAKFPVALASQSFVIDLREGAPKGRKRKKK